MTVTLVRFWLVSGGSVCYTGRSDDHNTAHIYVLSRVVSRLIRISVSRAATLACVRVWREHAPSGIDFLVKE